MRRPRVGLRPPQALLEVVAARTGVTRDLPKVVMFVHEWARLEVKLGRRVTIEEFIAASSDSRRTCYSRLELFRSVFPELGAKSTPGELIVWPEGIPQRVNVGDLAWRAVPA